MAKFLLSLLLLLGTSNALAQACFCAGPARPGFAGHCTANPTCWACAPGAYDSNWQLAFCPGYQPPAPACTYSATTEQRPCPLNFNGTQTWKRENNCIAGQAVDSGWFKISETCTPAPATCQASVETRQEGCLQNQSGSKTLTRQSTCPNPYGQPVWGQWQLTQDACKWNPPTCQISTQSQTLACQAGFTGSIVQTMTSTCPSPYGSPMWSGVWQTTSNSCVKSMTNPTNVLSPISPVSPLNPSSPVMSAPVTPIAPVTALPGPVQMMSQPTDSPEAPSSQPTQTSESPPPSQTSSGTSDAPSAGSSAPPRSAGTGARAVSITQRLEMIGAMPRQPSIVELISLKQELPDAVRRQQNLLSELIQPDDSWLARDFPSTYRRSGLFGD